MPSTGPNVYVIGGPNGAGKSTCARLLLPGVAILDYVNADTVARGLSAGSPAAQAMAAGRIVLERLKAAARRGADFAFETTMASRGLQGWLVRLQEQGYHVHALYLWLPTPEIAQQRVRSRVLAGGHDIPLETIRRRYLRGLNNFLAGYRALADGWVLYDNGAAVGPRPVACGGSELSEGRNDEDTWRRVLDSARG